MTMRKESRECVFLRGGAENKHENYFYIIFGIFYMRKRFIRRDQIRSYWYLINYLKLDGRKIK